ncbi:GNAT family N-acetyltransferase [Fusibacter sp. A2]|nr:MULTISPECIES: GNAT family N-acetyltransferase [unclassified Fusibacter]MCK8058162.1 GNAT family N-acetyltransferase [Fusibacter sp. A2]NPE20745.1 GNAT family N-acetyltransferase [Fusibacter sp. A1]
MLKNKTESVAAMILQWQDTIFWPEAKPAESGYLHKLCVRRDYAKTGLSTMMIEVAQMECAKKNVMKLRLDTGWQNTALRNLYEKNGFILYDQFVLDGRHEFARYEKRLEENVMIKKCTINELDEAVEFAFSKNQWVEERCRPFLVNEPVENIYADFKKYVETEFYDVLLQYDKDKLVGVTAIFWLVEDNYVSINRGIFAAKDYSVVAKRYLDYIQSNFKGYKYYINTAKEHQKSIDFYHAQGFELLEDAVLYKLDDFSGVSLISGMEELNTSNQDEIYTYLEPGITEDTYWNIERLKQQPEMFIIIGFFFDGLKGVIQARKYKNISVEIVGLEAEETQVKKDLMNALAKTCKDRGFKLIQLYTERQEEVQLGKELGYTYFDSNVCFLKKL